MPIRTEPARLRSRTFTAAVATAVLFGSVACSKHEASPSDTTASTAAAAPAGAGATTGAASDTALKLVRGTIAAINDTSVTVTTPTGAQQVHIVAPLQVYARTASDLAHVTPNTFVGITSVKQPDGSERATEIHIFPDALRGVGEGSRMMQPAAGGGGNARMTNGAVAQSRMTNGSVTTKGATRYTVQYAGGSQTIEVPAGVTVTAIAPVQTKPVAGDTVIVLARTGADGRLGATGIMLSGKPTK